MAHGDAGEGKWRGNWRMEWVASTLHTTSEHGVSSINTADAHTSAASSRLNWRPSRFKWIRPFRGKTKSGFCACDIKFQLPSTLGPNMKLTANLHLTPRFKLHGDKPPLQASEGVGGQRHVPAALLPEIPRCTLHWVYFGSHHLLKDALWECIRSATSKHEFLLFVFMCVCVCVVCVCGVWVCVCVCVW